MGLKLPKFASDYFEEWPDLFEQIKQLEIRRSIKVFRKIANETNEINFYSWLSEMKFGLLFDRFSTKLLYEKSIDSKTPD